MKTTQLFLIILFLTAMPVFAQDVPSSNDIIAKMRTSLDLQEDQVTNITPIVEKYTIAFHDLQRSIEDGTINPSVVDSQRRGLEAAETQELSQYLKPNQVSLWWGMQGQMEHRKVNISNDHADADADRYSNLPNY